MILKNPTLYALIGDIQHDDIVAEVAKDNGEAFFLSNIDEENIETKVRDIKVKMQSSQFDLGRANIYIVAKACCPQAHKLAIAAGRRIHTLFTEDFSALYIALVVVMDESNEGDCNTRNALTYKFLTSLTAGTAFDRIFLLSNRNEYGRIEPLQVGKLMANLPFLHLIPSQFEHVMQMKSGQMGRVLFASLGLGTSGEEYEKLYEAHLQNQRLHCLADILEQSINTPWVSSGTDREGYSNSTFHSLNSSPENSPDAASLELDFIQQRGKLPHDILSSESESSWPSYGKEELSILKQNSNCICADIASIASDPVSPVELNGLTVNEAESILFQGRAKARYDLLYKSDVEPMPTNTLPLQSILHEKTRLGEELKNISDEILQLEYNQVQLAQKKVRLFSINRGLAKAFAIIDSTKTDIGSYYAFTYQIECLKNTRDSINEKYDQISNFVDYMQQVIKSLRANELTPPCQDSTELLQEKAEACAILNISLLRTDGLINETHTIGESPKVLKIIGGFVLEDLTRYHAMRNAKLR